MPRVACCEHSALTKHCAACALLSVQYSQVSNKQDECIDDKKERKEVWQACGTHLDKEIDMQIDTATTVCVIGALKPDKVEEKMTCACVYMRVNRTHTYV